MKLITAYFTITRPLNFLISFFSIIVIGFICIDGDYSLIEIILAGISGAFTGSAGNIINDIFDIEIDRINRPNRPLPSGLISIKKAKVIYFFFLFASLLLSLFINYTALIIVIFANVVVFVYSFRFKKIPLLGNFVVAFITGLAFIYGGVAVNNWIDALFPALFAFLINFIREIVKDIEDIEGDTMKQVFTFPARYGNNSSLKLINLLTLSLIIAVIIPYLTGYYNQIFIISLLISVIPLLFYFIYSLNKDLSKKNLGRMSFILKLNMIFGLIAIYLGS